jgi:putative ABC transport system permease protein
MTPPRLAAVLLRWLLPAAWHEPIAGDLEEEWQASPSRARFWSLAVRSIAACWIDRLRPRVRPPQSNALQGDSAMQSLLQDVRYGARLMWRNPGFTLAAIATLALGIGANSAIFSIVNVLSLKSMPYHDPSRVAFVLGWDLEDNEMRFNLRHADLLDLRRDAKSFADLAGYTYLSANLTGGDIPDRVQAYRVTPNTFTLLGVAPLMGRVFDAADAGSGREDIAVISHALWQRRFGGDPSIVGRKIVINGTPSEIVGVMPRRFEYPVFNFKGDLWLPWHLRASERGQAGAAGSVTVVGRLKDGVDYAQAQAELDVLMSGFAARYPDTNREVGGRLIEMGKLDDEQAGPAVIIVLVTVAMVLLLACANVANLLLARGASRQRELAVRAAIGASRLRIARQLLIEGVLLALAGGAIGTVIAVVGLAAFRGSLPEVMLATQPNIDELGVDLATLGYTFVISLVTSIIFGVIPAWRAARDQFEGALKESASAGGGRGARRLRSALVVAEVALATVLLVTAGLLARSYAGLQRVNPGFEPAGVMTVAMTLPSYQYADAVSQRQFFDQLIARIEAMPGVSAAGLVNVLPFSTYDRGTRVTIDGGPAPEPGREPSVSLRIASARYHEAMRIPLIAGRMFDGRDTADGAPVAVVNEVFAARHFPNQPAIGRRVRLGAATAPWVTIVGVAGDVRHSSLTQSVQPEVYVPMSQVSSPMMMLAARTSLRPEELTASIRDAVRAIDPAQPIYHVKTLATLVGDSMGAQRLSAGMVTLFSGLALVLAAIGIYGVVSYGVSQQTREFGVRLALGATPADVLRQVLRGGGLMVGLGVGLGLAAALGASRLLAGVLVGISATDPLTYLGVAATLTATGLIACVIPARRASATIAVNALRAE